MPLVKLSAAELSSRGGRRSANGEYVRFLKGLVVGEGGEAIVATEGASRQTVKNRLQRAADESRVTLKFLRSGADSLVFEVVATESTARRRGRPPKASA